MDSQDVEAIARRLNWRDYIARMLKKSWMFDIDIEKILTENSTYDEGIVREHLHSEISSPWILNNTKSNV